MKFTIVIEETVVQKFEIDADNAEQAMKIAEVKYNNGEIILVPGECQFKQMSITLPKNEATEWIEF